MEELPKGWTAQDARRGPLQESQEKLRTPEPKPKAKTTSKAKAKADSTDEKN